MDGKPQCGSGSKPGAEEYDFALHLAGLFMVLVSSCLGAGFPVAATKLKWMKIPPKVFFACKHFGTGVLIATAFAHLIPTAFASLNDPCLPDVFTKFPPMPGVIMMVSMFALFMIEMHLHAKTGGHSHGGATGEGIISHASPAPHSAPDRGPEQEKNKTLADRGNQAILTSDLDVEAGVIDEQLYRKMVANIAILEGGILFHSIFVGMTASITTEGFVVLLVAILFHQIFEGLGLGSRIAAVPWKQQWRPWALVFAFGTTAPIGQAIGLAARTTWDPESALGLILVGVFNAISSGLLVYGALVDLLAEDFLKGSMTKRQQIAAFILVTLGAIGMSVVGAFA